MEYAIFDLDHTLADSSGRDHLLKAGRLDCHGLISSMTKQDWEAYHANCHIDPVKREVLRMYNGVRATRMRTIICTARPITFERQTIAWLKQHDIRYDQLLMRPKGDARPSAYLKVNLIADILGVNWYRRVGLVVDDHPDVIEAFSKFGVTCLLCKHNN